LTCFFCKSPGIEICLLCATLQLSNNWTEQLNVYRNITETRLAILLVMSLYPDFCYDHNIETLFEWRVNLDRGFLTKIFNNSCCLNYLLSTPMNMEVTAWELSSDCLLLHMHVAKRFKLSNFSDCFSFMPWITVRNVLLHYAFLSYPGYSCQTQSNYPHCIVSWVVLSIALSMSSLHGIIYTGVARVIHSSVILLVSSGRISISLHISCPQTIRLYAASRQRWQANATVLAGS
jgi:hypothetical protein